MVEAAAVPLTHLMRDAYELYIDRLHDGIHARGFPDVTPGHGRAVLAWVDENGARPGDIARQSRLTKASVAERLNDLEALGYVERVPIEGDGRGRLVVLTERGLALHKAADEARDEVQCKLAEALGQDRFEELRRTLSDVIDAMR